MEHILRGDRGDGVVNVLSPDNALVDGIRQTAIKETFIQEVLQMDDPHKGLSGDVLEKYKRNEKLVNLDFIPQEFVDKIIDTYTSATPKMDKMKLMSYFGKHKMKLMMAELQDF